MHLGKEPANPPDAEGVYPTLLPSVSPPPTVSSAPAAATSSSSLPLRPTREMDIPTKMPVPKVPHPVPPNRQDVPKSKHPVKRPTPRTLPISTGARYPTSKPIHKPHPKRARVKATFLVDMSVKVTQDGYGKQNVQVRQSVEVNQMKE